MSFIELEVDSIEAVLKMKPKEGEEESAPAITSVIKQVEVKQGQVTLVFKFECVT